MAVRTSEIKGFLRSTLTTARFSLLPTILPNQCSLACSSIAEATAKDHIESRVLVDLQKPCSKAHFTTAVESICHEVWILIDGDSRYENKEDWEDGTIRDFCQTTQGKEIEREKEQSAKKRKEKNHFLGFTHFSAKGSSKNGISPKETPKQFKKGEKRRIETPKSFSI
jgi:hypothetical protein